MARTLKERIIFELQDVRSDLLEAISSVKPHELDGAPAEGMRTYRGMLTEIGATEEHFLRQLTGQPRRPFKELEGEITGDSVSELMNHLTRTRERTLAYLDGLSDEDLRAPITVPEEWHWLGGGTDLELEETFRWIARHEYYHVGQIVSYRWADGHDPYA